MERAGRIGSSNEAGNLFSGHVTSGRATYKIGMFFFQIFTALKKSILLTLETQGSKKRIYID